MRALQLALAGVCFVLAAAGVFLPLLPTTPFLLLTSFFLVRSSPALHARLHRSPLFGPLLADWERQRGVRLSVKLSALGALATVVALNLGLGSFPRWFDLTLVAVAGLGALFILRLRTVRGGPAREDGRGERI